MCLWTDFDGICAVPGNGVGQVVVKNTRGKREGEMSSITVYQKRRSLPNLKKKDKENQYNTHTLSDILTSFVPQSPTGYVLMG